MLSREVAELKIFEPGDVVHFPVLTDSTGPTMTVKGGRIYQYKSGKKYVQYLFDGHTEEGDGMTDRLAQTIKASIAKEYDTIGIILGKVGVGKSNLGVDLCKSFDETFTLEERYVFDLLPFMKYLRDHWNELKPGMCFLMDEAINIANNREWQNQVNVSFGKFLTMFRSLGLILIMIIPEKKRLDNYLREGERVRFLAECKDLPNGGMYEGRGFYELTIDGHTPGLGTFPEMNTDVIDDYIKKKKEGQYQKLDEMIESMESSNGKGAKRLVESTDRNKKMVSYFLDEGWSYQDISDRFDIPYNTVKRWAFEIYKNKDQGAS